MALVATQGQLKSPGFTPRNGRERQLLAAREGQVQPEDFVRTLLGSEVCMPVDEKHQIGGPQTGGTTAQPLKRARRRRRRAGALYQPRAGKGIRQGLPGLRRGSGDRVHLDPGEVGIGYAIRLNPDLEVGMDFAAQDFAQTAPRHGRAH